MFKFDMVCNPKIFEDKVRGSIFTNLLEVPFEVSEQVENLNFKIEVLSDSPYMTYLSVLDGIKHSDKFYMERFTSCRDSYFFSLKNYEDNHDKVCIEINKIHKNDDYARIRGHWYNMLVVDITHYEHIPKYINDEFCCRVPIIIKPTYRCDPETVLLYRFKGMLREE